jgi:hypothetical protein
MRVIHRVTLAAAASVAGSAIVAAGVAIAPVAGFVRGRIQLALDRCLYQARER